MPDPNPPTPEQVQAEIRRALIEAELRLRRWLGTPAGRRAALAVPAAAGAAGVGLLALKAIGRWRRGRRLSRSLATMTPVETAGRPTLAFIAESILGLTRADVARLLGRPTRRGEASDVYVLGGAAMAVEFNDAGRACRVEFLEQRAE